MDELSELQPGEKPDTGFREQPTLAPGEYRRILDMLPTETRAAVDRGMTARPELFGCDEMTLLKLLRKEEATPNIADNRLKLNFWFEFGRCKESGERKLNLIHVAGYICDIDYFYRYMRQPEKAAWILCPPSGYINRLKEALTFSIIQLRDVLELAHENQGEIDYKLIDRKQNIAEMLHDWEHEVVGKKPRVRAEQEPEATKQVMTHAAGQSTDQLKERLKELEARGRKLKHLPDGAV